MNLFISSYNLLITLPDLALQAVQSVLNLPTHFLHVLSQSIQKYLIPLLATGSKSESKYFLYSLEPQGTF